MIRIVALGLLSMVLIGSPSSANAGLMLTGAMYHSAYAEDDPNFDVQDYFAGAFPDSNSLSASIVGASGRESFSQTQTGYLTEFQSSMYGDVSGFADTEDRSRYGQGFFVGGFTVSNNSKYSYSMSVSTTGSADNLFSNVVLLDGNTGVEEFNVSTTASNSGTLLAGHTYYFFGMVYAENFSALNGGSGDTGSVSADFDFQVTSTPEPSSLALLGFGILGMGGYGWRRRKSRATA